MTGPADSAGRVVAVACEWLLDEPNSDTWATDCGHWFTLNDGTPQQNRMLFCCYCGQPIAVAEEPTNEGRHTLPGAAPDKPPRDHWARKVLP